MTLSKLQKYILKRALNVPDKLLRRKLLDYYRNFKSKPSRKDQMNIIHRSINRLIDKGLLVGYGRRTKEKWFYTFIRLTPKGKQIALDIRKQRQQKLPLKKLKKYIINKK